MKSVIRASLAIGAIVMSQQWLSAQEKNAAPAASATPPAVAAMKGPLDTSLKTITGKEVKLAEKYKGKVVLLVNVASKCGNTPQYAPLQAMHKKFAEQGLAVVGVPCNQFRSQEPGTEAEILEFCQETYGVEFDMMAKADVNGENAAPIYKYLTSKETNPKFAGDITWNFEKFLIGRDGQVVARFAPRTRPDSPDVLKAIETELGKKAGTTTSSP
jgi:glutathione peroxidase